MRLLGSVLRPKAQFLDHGLRATAVRRKVDFDCRLWGRLRVGRLAGGQKTEANESNQDSFHGPYRPYRVLSCSPTVCFRQQAHQDFLVLRNVAR
jgi:hypothetical protein